MAFNDDVIKRIGSGGHDIKKMMTSEVIGYRHLNIRKNLYSKSKLKWTVDVIEIVNKKVIAEAPLGTDPSTGIPSE